VIGKTGAKAQVISPQLSQKQIAAESWIRCEGEIGRATTNHT
jgi:hypothetical protein